MSGSINSYVLSRTAVGGAERGSENVRAERSSTAFVGRGERAGASESWPLVPGHVAPSRPMFMRSEVTGKPVHLRETPRMGPDSPSIGPLIPEHRSPRNLPLVPMETRPLPQGPAQLVAGAGKPLTGMAALVPGGGPPLQGPGALVAGAGKPLAGLAQLVSAPAAGRLQAPSLFGGSEVQNASAPSLRSNRGPSGPEEDEPASRPVRVASVFDPVRRVG